MKTQTETDTFIVVAYGGGVNSTAMLVLMKRRGIIPRLILFADTGGERPETITGVQKVSDWCVANGMPAIITVRQESKTFGGENLEQNCLRTKSLPSIAYGFKSCSEKFKIRPQNRFFANWKPAIDWWKTGQKITKFIGYDAGEERRAKISSDNRYLFRYPLIEWQVYREDCVEICEIEGLPILKSACFYCPSSTKPNIRMLAKDYPELFQRALAMESNANLTSIKGLGRKFAWSSLLSEIESSTEPAPEIPCGCYDG